MSISHSADPGNYPTPDDIDPGSYTALRLQHASVQHLNLTTRRCFIGPIPEGWLKSHRKSWYKEALNISNYSSRAATFSARPGLSHHKQITGLDGPSTSAAFVHSFPQPEDVDEEEGENDDIEDNGDVGNPSDEDSENGPDDEQVNEIEAVSTEPGGQDERSLPGRAKTPSFVTAHSKPRNTLTSRLKSRTTKSPPPASFVTAKESPDKKNRVSSVAFDGGNEESAQSKSPESKPHGSPISPTSETQPRSSNGKLDEPIGTDSTANLLPSGKASSSKQTTPDLNLADPELEPDSSQQVQKIGTAGLVKFNLDPQPEESHEVRRAKKINRVGPQKIWKRLRRGTAHPGEIVKLEKMLVRVDFTIHELPEDYDENDSLKVEARAIDKWQEFVVVCRESTDDESQFSLQMYKTRVIPAKEEPHFRKRSTHEIPLNPKNTRVNLYSSLDKTLVIWVPWKNSQTLIYILRTRSAASAVEWYTFLRNSLGWQRSSDLMVNVPDLNVTLQLENPFSDLETSMTKAQKSRADDETIQKTMEAEKAIASSIIQRSLKMLENNPEWADVLAAWLAREKVGLAWKRYDRLEWVHGANEQRMYGTMAMQRTHELELRPKAHYPTSVNSKNETLVEPAPVEGFLIRLTSQKGHVKRLGKMYFKRLYFAVHDQYLVYTRPAKALPPPPPKLSLNNDGNVPGAKEIVDKIPLIFAVNPYPDNNQDGEVDWIQYGSRATKERRNREAYKEAERKINTMLKAEGYIDLSHVVRVQNAQRGNSPADANVDQGPDVDFHTEVPDTTRDDGKTTQFDDDRTFELVMRNKLVIRLQAFNPATKKEWISRLRRLVTYWHHRLAADMALFKSVRAANLARISIDEKQEALLGQFGKKWEVTRSVASPKLFNMCPISCCRAITLSGPLYHKPRRHTTFQRCSVILCHGTLLLFQHTLRTRTGRELRHIQHPRQMRLDLSTCYVYSGLITDSDLLYQNNNNTTFDAARPGHHALPRVYLEDGWTSTDEDTMTTFVIWQPRNKSWFRAPSEDVDSTPSPAVQDQGEQQQSRHGTGFGLSFERKGRASSKLRYVTRLGVPGRSIVFKTRSRAERDHWVMGIGMEIERLQQGGGGEMGSLQGSGGGGVGEEIRVVDGR